MDKVQKELLDTYFRKRRPIAMSMEYGFSAEELKYLVDNGTLDFNKLLPMEQLSVNPDVAVRFKFTLRGMDSNEIVRVLVSYPRLYMYMNLDNLSGAGMADLINKRPELVNRLPKSRLDGSHISYVLRMHPELIDHLPIAKMKGYEIYILLSSKPQLIDKVDLNKIEWDYLEMLTDEHPKIAPMLKPYMDKIIFDHNDL